MKTFTYCKYKQTTITLQEYPQDFDKHKIANCILSLPNCILSMPRTADLTTKSLQLIEPLSGNRKNESNEHYEKD